MLQLFPGVLKRYSRKAALAEPGAVSETQKHQPRDTEVPQRSRGKCVCLGNIECGRPEVLLLRRTAVRTGGNCWKRLFIPCGFIQITGTLKNKIKKKSANFKAQQKEKTQYVPVVMGKTASHIYTLRSHLQSGQQVTDLNINKH